MASVLIFAGGTGSRMGNTSAPKQFLDYGGKPLIIHTIEHFQMHEGISRIVVVVPTGWIDKFWLMVSRFGLTKVVAVVPGGTTGQESIYFGLKALAEGDFTPDEVVLVHDGVRPLINHRIIEECIDMAAKTGGAVTVYPAVETIVSSENGKNIEEIYQRDKLYTAQAPQAFKLLDLLSAHEQARSESLAEFIDSCSMMLALKGVKSSFVIGSRANIKVTTPEDYYMSSALLQLERMHEVEGL